MVILREGKGREKNGYPFRRLLHPIKSLHPLEEILYPPLFVEIDAERHQTFMLPY